MSTPIGGPSVRETDPWTVSAGVGGPDMLRVEATRNLNDDFALGARAGIGPMGVSASVVGIWHALKSNSHGHSLIAVGGGTVAPRGAEGGGNSNPIFGLEAGLGWEYRSTHGPTVRVHGGAGYYTQPGPGAESGFGPAIGIMAGWSF